MTIHILIFPSRKASIITNMFCVDNDSFDEINKDNILVYQNSFIL